MILSAATRAPVVRSEKFTTYHEMPQTFTFPGEAPTAQRQQQAPAARQQQQQLIQHQHQTPPTARRQHQHQQAPPAPARRETRRRPPSPSSSSRSSSRSPSPPPATRTYRSQPIVAEPRSNGPRTGIGSGAYAAGAYAGGGSSTFDTRAYMSSRRKDARRALSNALSVVAQAESAHTASWTSVSRHRIERAAEASDEMRRVAFALKDAQRSIERIRSGI